jgi:hypothetical protein
VFSRRSPPVLHALARDGRKRSERCHVAAS